jgi:hypothetical protein
MSLHPFLRLLSFTVPTSWGVALGWKAEGIRGAMTGLIIGLALGFPCRRGILSIVRHLVSSQREKRHTSLYWIVFAGLMWLVIAVWIGGFTWAGVKLTRFLMKQ